MRTIFIGSLLAALAATPLGASAILVSLNTTVLQSNPDAPFYLNFQLNGSAGNTATLSSFTGIGTLNSPAGAVSFGDYTASPTDVTLSTLVSAFNSVVIPFAPGASLGFQVNLTNNGSVTPDQFSFTILRSGFVEIPVDTSSPAGFLGALLTVEILGSGQVSISTAGGDPFQPPYDQLSPPSAVETSADIPEPATLWLTGLALVGLSLARVGIARRLHN